MRRQETDVRRENTDVRCVVFHPVAEDKRSSLFSRSKVKRLMPPIPVDQGPDGDAEIEVEGRPEEVVLSVHAQPRRAKGPII
jgi:hypothetical protein